MKEEGHYIPEVRFLQSTLNNTRRCFAVVCHKFAANNGGADDSGSIDDLFDPGDTESHIHRCHPSKMKRLQSHLCSWFSNRLRPNRPYGRSWDEEGISGV